MATKSHQANGTKDAYTAQKSVDKTVDFAGDDGPRANRRRTRTEGSNVFGPSSSDRGNASNSLRFLERAGHSASSRMGAAVDQPSPWPEGYVPRPATTTRARAATLNDPLAFLERRSPAGLSTAGPTLGAGSRGIAADNVTIGGGSEGGLGSLSGGIIAAGVGRGGFLPDMRDRGSSDEEDEDDDNVCPSMLFSCFPCLACFRSGNPRRRRRSTAEGQLEVDVIKCRSRSQTSLTTPLLSDQGSSLEYFPKDVKLLEVEVESAKNVPASETASSANSGGTSVSLRMTPVQQGVGEQSQQTSLARRIANPRWGHRETFTFFVTDTRTSAKAYLSVYLKHRPHRPTSAPPSPVANGRGSNLVLDHHTSSSGSLNAGSLQDDVVLGEGFVDLLRLFPPQQSTYINGGKRGNSRRIAVPMRDPVEKRPTNCAVMLGIRCCRIHESNDTHEDRVYEYERWTPIAGWSAIGNRDTKKWSTLDGSVFSATFAEVAPPARKDSEIVLPWCPFGGWEYSREDHPTENRGTGTTESEGQTRSTRSTGTSAANGSEALGQKGTVWMEGYLPGYEGVRRRLWRRVYLKRETAVTADDDKWVAHDVVEQSSVDQPSNRP